MNELPESWTTAPLSAFSTDVRQRVPDAAETFTYIDIGSVDRETKTITAPQVLLGKDAPSRARKQVATGDTLVSMTRPNLNAVALVPPSLDGQIASTGFDVLRPLDEIDPRWLAYLVRTEQFVSAMSELVQGALYPAVRTKDVRAYVAPIAPHEEQTRIANQLDTLLARIQACNDRLAAIPALLKRLREAVLVFATTGELTAEWRTAHLPVTSAAELLRSLEADYAEAGGHQRGNASEPTEEAHDLSVDQIPNGWEISTLRNCCRPGRPITYGILKPGPELEEGVPYVRVADFPGNQLNLSSIKRTSPEIDLQYKRARLSAGDLLLSIRGSVGRLIVIPPSLEGANITQDTARLSISSRLNARYIYYALLSPDAQRRMAKAIRGVAVRGINIGDVRALQVPLPSLPEQDEIVRRIDALFEIAARIEASHVTARRLVSRLTPLTLAKAFRGELVSQDPSDEPASALLARIAALREGATSVPKIRQPRAPRVARAPKDSAAMTKTRQDDDVKGKPYLAGHLRRLGQPVEAQVLFKASELPVADFYKQLAWEVAQGLVKDNTTTLEPGHAAG